MGSHDFEQLRNSESGGAISTKSKHFLIFVTGYTISALLVGLFVVHFQNEKHAVDKDIALLESRLKVLLNAQQSKISLSTLQKISDAISKEQKCYPEYGIADYILKPTDERNANRVEMWNTFQRPFLYLVGRDKLHTTVANSGLHSVVGWEYGGGSNCTDIDPQTDGTDIVIPRAGHYSIFSQITFHTKAEDVPSIHRHIVRYIEVFGNTLDEPKVLMENAYQIQSGKSKVSYQSAVYRFNENDILRILVAKSPHTTVTVKDGDAYFGIMRL